MHLICWINKQQVLYGYSHLNSSKNNYNLYIPSSNEIDGYETGFLLFTDVVCSPAQSRTVSSEYSRRKPTSDDCLSSSIQTPSLNGVNKNSFWALSMSVCRPRLHGCKHMTH